jgi:cytochrome c1
LSGRRDLPFRAAIATALVLGSALAAGGYFFKQARVAREMAAELTGGDPERGRVLMVRYGCSACHRTPGVWPAGEGVGPPLGGLSQRVYVGGVLLNTPANLVAWIVDPRAIDPLTAMPRTGISEPEAQDVAAYLYATR